MFQCTFWYWIYFYLCCDWLTVREQCKVLFPYEAQNEDELSLKEGDIINIITKVSVGISVGALCWQSFMMSALIITETVIQDCADAGWWMGENAGRQGVFPDNFVKLLEVEKEVIVASWRWSRSYLLMPKSHLNPFLGWFFVRVFSETEETPTTQRSIS